VAQSENGTPDPHSSEAARAATILRCALDAAHEGLLLLDEHGTIVESNSTAAALLGRDPTSLSGVSLPAIAEPGDQERLHQLLLDVQRAGTARIDVHVAGEALHVTFRAVPQVIPRAIAVTLARERPAEPHLAHHLLRFGVPTIAFDRDLRVVFSNAAARRLLGDATLRRDAILGQERVGELRPLLQRLTRVDTPLRPTIVRLPDERFLRVHGLAATGADPAVLFAEDVTDELHHDRVMREFLRNAAHQLRTPLAGITAAIETLQSGAKEHPPDRDHFLDHLETHTERLTRITRGLLLLARAEAGETLATDSVELQPLLGEIAAEASPRRGVEVHADCQPGLAVLATRDLLHEALMALVDNAVSHTSDGEIRVSAVRSHGHVLVSVADSGPGIAPELHDRIFEPFFRATPTGEGYGLGLAIAARAVHAMHGDIGVSSTVGAGTTFTVTLPAATVTR